MEDLREDQFGKRAKKLKVKKEQSKNAGQKEEKTRYYEGKLQKTSKFKIYLKNRRKNYF